MSIRSDPLDELAIPDGTTVEEHDLVTDGDVVVGGQSTVGFGVRGDSVIAGERVEFGGHIEAEGDCRLDMWSAVAEDVLVGGDAYLGERASVGGRLKVAGNVDVGDDVDIEDRFEANGRITIRNPMPTVVFLIVYLSQLLRIGEEEAAEQLASQLVESEDGDDRPVVIPRGAQVSDDAWRVSTPATVGDDCRLHGNVRAESLDVGEDTVVFGSLRAKGDVTVGSATEVKGDVTTRNGDVYVDSGAHVWGDISAEDVRLHEHAVVDGRIRVSGELTQVRDPLGPRPAPDDADDESDDETAIEEPDDRTADETHGDATGDSDASDDSFDDGQTDEATARDGRPGSAAVDGARSTTADGSDETGEDADDWGDIESREAVEAALDGVVPLVDADESRRTNDDSGENGHDEDVDGIRVE